MAKLVAIDSEPGLGLLTRFKPECLLIVFGTLFAYIIFILYYVEFFGICT